MNRGPNCCSVLVVDDEASICQAVVDTLEPQYRVVSAESAEQGMALAQKETFDLVLSDIRLPGMDGIAFLKELRLLDPETVVVMITAYASVETAVRALKAGAYEYLVKPFGPDEIRKIVTRAVETRQLRLDNESWRKATYDPSVSDVYVGESAAMRQLYAFAEQVAVTNAAVFINGESGSGKEYLARFIHAHSNRSERPLVPVNCASLSENLMSSEMFGHVKGAFTGAVAPHRGYLELADRGTLLLDEIAELKPELQARLLRVIEDRMVTRLGSERPVMVDVRYIAAAQKPPEQLVREGKLREDLFFRLGVVTLQIPPLRDRLDDLPGLAAHLCAVLRRELKKDFGPPSREVIAALRAHTWPGNVRELRNVLERAAIFARSGQEIEVRHLPTSMRGAQAGQPFVIEAGHLPTVDEVTQRYARHVIELCDDNRTKAARILGVAPSTLWRWERGDAGESS